MRVNEEDGEEDDDMEIISHTFDPRGIKDRLFLEKKSKISKLTELKPEVKFNYSEYVEKIIEAEDENKDKNRKSIPVICLDWDQSKKVKVLHWKYLSQESFKIFWFYVFW